MCFPRILLWILGEQDNSVIQYFKDLPKSNEKLKYIFQNIFMSVLVKVENVDEYMYKSKANIIQKLINIIVGLQEKHLFF